MQWEPNNNLLAQGLHIALGALFTLLPFALNMHHPEYGAISIMAFAFLKDFTFDIFVEKDTVQGSLRDVCFYGVGVALAGILLLFR